MSRALKQYDPYELRAKQERYFKGAVYDEYQPPKEEQTMVNTTRLTREPAAAERQQEELDFDKPVEGESKLERFRRVANHRLKTSVERLRMLRQMFEGSTVNNYEFTGEQRDLIVKTLRDEVNEIERLMTRRLDRREGEIPQL